MKALFYTCLIFCCFSWACQGELVIVPDNEAPDYSGVPTLNVQNYVNRLCIDLLGREPIDAEMDAWVAELRQGELQKEARVALVQRLMTNTSFVEGDSSYMIAYYNRLYDQMKVRFMEGVGDGRIRADISIIGFGAEKDSINGNWPGYQAARFEMEKMGSILTSRYRYRKGQISIFEMAEYMVFNAVYDEINMNSINFIRATFNDLFFRFHTQDEFDRAFQIIEFSQPQVIFGKSAGDKLEYIEVLTATREAYEGMIRWAYQGLLAREPSAVEVSSAIDAFFQTNNYQKVQQDILVKDEYARF